MPVQIGFLRSRNAHIPSWLLGIHCVSTSIAFIIPAWYDPCGWIIPSAVAVSFGQIFPTDCLQHQLAMHGSIIIEGHQPRRVI